MIHELRIYTLKVGTGATVAKNAAEVGRAIRGDNYGKLEGYWITEIGPLNPYERRIVHMAIAEDPQVSSESIGDAFMKTVIISSRP